jgi:hypothetical protein
MKKIIIGIVILMALTAQAFAQEGAKGKEAVKDAAVKQEEEKAIGLGFSINYYSKYIWRGIDFYQGDGYFYPSISWEIFGTGLKLTAAAEVASSWVFNGFRGEPKRYYLDDFSGSVWHKKQKKINHYAYANMGLDLSAEYSYTFENIITLGASFWYYWYYNSKEAREMAWTKIESYNIVKKWDTSYFSVGFNIGLDCVPWINPTIAVFYDNYYGYKRAGDYYVQLGFSHEFVLVKDVVTITPGITAGYYYGRTYGYDNWYLASLDGVDFDVSTDFIWRQHVALKKGVSDIDPSVTVSVTKGGFTFTSAFFWVITPAKSWYKGGPVHKYYAQVGLAYNL